MLDILKVLNKSDISSVVKMAKEIWSSHYIPIIGQDQIDYMLKNFQNDDAIKKQMDSGYKYFIAKFDDDFAGYFSILENLSEKSVFLSKIYIYQKYRGKGISRTIINYIEDNFNNKPLKKIHLTVNKNNTASINIYKKLGFIIKDSIVKDIGNGFVMDDYVMEKFFHRDNI